MKNKKILSLVLIVMVLMLTVSAAYAWFNLSIKNESNFRISDFEIDVLVSDNESTFNTQLNPDEPLFDFNGKYSLEPGDSQTKYLKIINNGDIPVAYELLFSGTGDLLADYIFVDIEKQGNITTVKGSELSTVKFGTGEKLRQNDFVIYCLTVTFNASLEEIELLNGETFKLETIISAWQFNFDESKPVASTTETIDILDHTYTGWVDGENHIIISYDVSNMLEIKISPKIISGSLGGSVFIDYIKVDGNLIDISYIAGVDNGDDTFKTEPLIKDIATFSDYRYGSDGVLMIRLPVEGQELGTEYILVDVSNANSFEIYLRTIESKEQVVYTVTKTEIN